MPQPDYSLSSVDVAWLARRLRYARRQCSPLGHTLTPDQRVGAAMAYEHTLKMIIDETKDGKDNYHHLFYGPQGEDADLPYGFNQ